MVWRWRSIVALVVMAAILVPLVLTGEARPSMGSGTPVASPVATKPAPPPVAVLPSTGIAERDAGSVWRPYAGAAILVLAVVGVVAFGMRQRRA